MCTLESLTLLFRAGLKRTSVIAGAGPAVALWSLKLASGYYAGPLGASSALCMQQAHQDHPGVGDELTWAPLLQSAFLDSLGVMLQDTWERHCLLPSRRPGAVQGSLLETLISTSTFPQRTAASDAQRCALHEAERLFGACLVMRDLPYTVELSSAVQQLRGLLPELPKQLTQTSGSAEPLVPLLSMLMPHIPPSAAGCVAAAVRL